MMRKMASYLADNNAQLTLEDVAKEAIKTGDKRSAQDVRMATIIILKAIGARSYMPSTEKERILEMSERKGEETASMVRNLGLYPKEEGIQRLFESTNPHGLCGAMCLKFLRAFFIQDKSLLDSKAPNNLKIYLDNFLLKDSYLFHFYGVFTVSLRYYTDLDETFSALFKEPSINYVCYGKYMDPHAHVVVVIVHKKEAKSRGLYYNPNSGAALITDQDAFKKVFVKEFNDIFGDKNTMPFSLCYGLEIQTSPTNQKVRDVLNMVGDVDNEDEYISKEQLEEVNKQVDIFISKTNIF